MRPDGTSPAGHATSAEAGKIVLLAVLTYLAAHASGLATMIGPAGTTIATIAAGLAQAMRLFGEGPKAAELLYDPALGGLGVLHPLPGDADALGWFRFAGPWPPAPPPAYLPMDRADSPDVIPFTPKPEATVSGE